MIKCLRTLYFLLPLFFVKAVCADQNSYTIPSQKTHDVIPLVSQDRKSSFPYISGDAFREFCTFIIDETRIPFNPHAVADGDTIFLNADQLDYFFSTIHPNVHARYLLVTHNSDYDIPGKYASYLDEPNLAAWFGQNVTLKHPKLFPLPIGLANKHWKHGNPVTVTQAITNLTSQPIEKKLLYMNFGITHPARSMVYRLFLEQPFCTARCVKNSIEHTGLEPYEHLAELAHHTFVLSPRGNGLDTHRTWETLLMGSIPIVQTSASDSLYDDLPVLIVDDWTQITQEYLNRVYEEMAKKTYKLEKIYAPYWLDQISAVQALIRTTGDSCS